MKDSGEIFVGLMVAALGFAGLVLASGALDDEMYLFGFSLAGFALFFDLMLLKHHYDRVDAARAEVRPMARGAARHD